MNNLGFVNDQDDVCTLGTKKTVTNVEQGFSGTSPAEGERPTDVNVVKVNAAEAGTRENWGHGIEFLMSCIAMSVGLGNVWRFPFTALDNGGGAFLLPYIIVLFVIGRPLYYLEMVLGQFSSRNSLKVYDIIPFFRGNGMGQLIGISLLATYYSSLMALIARYLYDSFQTPLPWANCRATWPNCIDASGNITGNFTAVSTSNALSPVTFVDEYGNPKQLTSSSEYYFQKEVLQQIDSIHDGIGTPILNLSVFLLISWAFIAGVMIRGIRSSGKASYFLALFPYAVIGILLARAVTLPGAWNGILYFIRPQWDKLFDPKVWFAAITQCFFSLAVGFGNIIMYASFNKFEHNVYRDMTIVTTLDTFTSLFAGSTIFGLLGHLAHQIGTDDIGAVVNGGPGLAFISYPEAITRFDFYPQIFAIMFFFMLFILGIGSNIAMCSVIITIVRDYFPKLKAWHAACLVATCGFFISLIYITPGGQFMVTLIDFFGTSYIIFMMALMEIIAVCWIYGVDRLCRDIEFMIDHKPGLYWRVCWAVITPGLMLCILIYTFVTYQPLKFGEYMYPDWAYALGWTISMFGIIQVPLWAFFAVLMQRKVTIRDRFRNAFQPMSSWGPLNAATFDRYQKYVRSYEIQQSLRPRGNALVRLKRHIFG